jgi:hypothetical protein
VESRLAPLISETRKAWKVAVSQGAVFEFSDPDVQRVFDTSRAVAVSCFEFQDKNLIPIGNPFQYRDFYLRDGARLARALALVGREDLAQVILRHMYEFQWPPGAFLSQKGQLDGTGQVLWTLSQLTQLGSNREWVTPYLEPSQRAAEWIQRMRAYSTARGSYSAGLLPFSDPRDNELVNGHLLGSDAWAYAGLRGLANVYESQGEGAEAKRWKAEAERWNTEADDYRNTLAQIWARETIRQKRPLPPAVEFGGRDWGNLSAVYPLGVFSAEDGVAVELDTWMRSNRYSQGLPYYGTPDSLHHYLGFDLTQASLRRGERQQVSIDLMAYVERCQPDGTGFEIMDRESRDFAQNLPPHPTFAAMFVDLARSILVYEEDQILHLFSGVPQAWFEAGAEMGFKEAPTNWGPATAELRMEDGGTLVLDVNLPTTAVVELPKDFVISQVEGGDYILNVEESRIHLPPGRHEWTIRYR